MDNNSAETARLLEQVRGGDQVAVNELLARHRPRLRRMVELRPDRRLHARIDESDVIQEAYVDAVTRLGEYVREPSYLRALKRLKAILATMPGGLDNV